MNYNFEFNSSAMGRIQPFEYSYALTNEYAFTYGRDIFSDLSKFNAPIFVTKRIRGIFSYDKNYLLEKDDNNMSIFNNPKKGLLKDKEFNIFIKDKIGRENVNNLDFINNKDKFANKDIILQIFKEILLKQEVNILNIFNDYFCKNYTSKQITITKMKSGKKDFHLEVFDNYFLSYPDKILNEFKNISLKTITNKKMKVYKEVLLQEQDNILNVYNNYLAKPLNEKKNLSSYIDYFVSMKKYINELYIFKQITYKDDNKLKINVYNNFFVKQVNTKQTTTYKLPGLANYKKKLIKSKDIVLGYRPKRKMSFRKENLFAYIFDQKLFIEQNVLLSKYKLGFNINDTEKSLNEIKNGFSIFNKNLQANEKRIGFVINSTEIFMDIQRKGFVIDDYTESIYRDKYSISINITDIELSKMKLPLGIESHENTIGFIVSSKDLHKENNNKMISAKQRNVFTNETNYFLSKEEKRTSNNLKNIFIITKQRKAFLEYYHGIMLYKKAKETMTNIVHSFIEKNAKTGIMYNDNENVIKNYKQVFIKENFNISKKRKDLLKNNEDIFNKKELKKSYLITTEVFSDKLSKRTSIANALWIKSNSKITSTFDYNLFITKDAYEAFVVNDNIYIDKIEHSSFIDNNIFIEKNEKELYKDKSMITTDKGNYKADIDDYVFITKQQYDSNEYVAELMNMQKTIKDLEKSVEKTYNWAYVYQYEDPIDPNYDYYGLDELLLPEKDIDYSSFEDVIFDKKTMTPKNPIKILDNNTFIAKYPVRHPTPDYEEIGIAYTDVPSELMHTIFIKFYQIWYANIFKFGNMSMIESLRLMLEYMYAHIVTTYSGSEYFEPALRVFRQIRWFGETSVMHNAQYKITCEYEDLKSNLQTGECLIKNQVSGFFIDNNLKVFSTESTSIGQEAYIKLYASNREDSEISFSVSFTGGNVDVYINGSLVDTIYSNHARISYELPATDTENEIVLKRSANNNYGYCYIGNIIIKNGTYKNLNIEYDPELKAGNMPLNDIVNKMVILANMYDNEQEAFEQFRKGNLAVSELYKRLENYWELHHANKIKGKRLTIKET